MKIRPVVLVGVLALQALPTFSGEIQKKTYEMDEVLVTASPEKIPKYIQNVLVNLSASYRIWEDKTRRLEFLLAGENLLDTP
ncbi:MAG: hypothetical protein D3919_10975 [Candidatus Electrothrix sp. AW5]|nr:hypothetical protein [Candidatus Electrothrix gigas]